ncbi:MAG: EamA family transporter [Flavobacteriaceae bacterium]|nr:EamA family transporter [Flavobacteriaceae bacterium]
MQNDRLKWIYLAILSIIWGSSFILIKKGLLGLTAMQLGAVRIIFAGFFLFLIGFPSIKKIPKKTWKWVAISGFLGTFFPAFFFSYAETEIDSSIASILNSFTPLNTLVFGYLVFQLNFSRQQVLGVVVGLAGTLLLIFAGAQVNPDQNYYYALFVLAASICYAFNVNIIKRYLQDLSAMSIAVGNFLVIMIPAIFTLIFSGFFDQDVTENEVIMESLGYLVLLAVFGTGFAKIMFNKLVQMATPVFATSVTYTIPIVALLWGILDGERLNVLQIIAAGIILLGVYLANKKKK